MEKELVELTMVDADCILTAMAELVTAISAPKEQWWDPICVFIRAEIPGQLVPLRYRQHFCDRIVRHYGRALMAPGTNVGVLNTIQVVERLTQGSLSRFHNTGVARNEDVMSATALNRMINPNSSENAPQMIIPLRNTVPAKAEGTTRGLLFRNIGNMVEGYKVALLREEILGVSGTMGIPTSVKTIVEGIINRPVIEASLSTYPPSIMIGESLWPLAILIQLSAYEMVSSSATCWGIASAIPCVSWPLTTVMLRMVSIPFRREKQQLGEEDIEGGGGGGEDCILIIAFASSVVRSVVSPLMPSEWIDSESTMREIVVGFQTSGAIIPTSSRNGGDISTATAAYGSFTPSLKQQLHCLMGTFWLDDESSLSSEEKFWIDCSSACALVDSTNIGYTRLVQRLLLQAIVMPRLMRSTLCGIQGINDLSVLPDSNNVHTSGSNLNSVLVLHEQRIPNVDRNKVTSTSVTQMHATYGLCNLVHSAIKPAVSESIGVHHGALRTLGAILSHKGVWGGFRPNTMHAERLGPLSSMCWEDPFCEVSIPSFFSQMWWQVSLSCNTYRRASQIWHAVFHAWC